MDCEVRIFFKLETKAKTLFYFHYWLIQDSSFKMIVILFYFVCLSNSLTMRLEVFWLVFD